QRDMGVVVNHCAAAWADLREPVGEHAADKANIRREGSVDMGLQHPWNCRHGFLRLVSGQSATSRSSSRAVAKLLSSSISSVMSAVTRSKPELFSRVF